MKKQKGVTLISLALTIAIMIILTFTIAVNIEPYKNEKVRTNYETDMTRLQEEISQYYARVKDIPIINKYTNTSMLEGIKNINDGSDYYVIDIKQLELELNYGKDYYKVVKKAETEEITDLLDVYIINKQSHTIYYPKGAEYNGTVHYRIAEVYSEVRDTIVGKIVTGTNKTYTKNGTAVIPVGFAIVPGLDDVSKGLVISDVANDTANIGNQFVWIPVDKETFDTKFKRTEGYFDGYLAANLGDCGEANAAGVNTKVTEDSTTINEAKAMYESVKINGGFYIGRYEAGTTVATGTGKRGELVVKKGANVYNNIGWSNSTDMANVAGGAVEVSRGMYTGKKTSNGENYGVASTLCYGVQWDAALNFIDSDYITNEVNGKPNCKSDSYLVNSTGKGWYNANYAIGNSTHLIGIDVDDKSSNKLKNIYDMAGNVIEWTMESNASDRRVTRGRLLRISWP